MHDILRKKLIVFTAVSVTFVLLIAFIILKTLYGIDNRFDAYKTIAVQGQITTLKISTDVNYVSRCARDMMLGNEIELNFEKINQSIERIENSFKTLKKSLKAFENSSEMKLLIEQTELSTLEFVHDAQSKMKYIVLDQGRTDIYKQYKLEATPLAIHSRELFKRLQKKQEEYFSMIEVDLEEKMKKQKDMIFTAAILVIFLFFVIIRAFFRQIIQKSEVHNDLEKTKQLLLQYKNAIDKTNIVSKTDVYGNITYVNDEFCKVSQYSRKELLRQPHNIIRHPDLPKSVFKELWKTIQSKSTWQGIIENKKKDGSSYFVDTTVMPILDKDGKVDEYIAIRKDITELVELNQRLTSSQDEILTRIGMIAETRSKETSNHVKRVAEYSKIIARNYGMDEKEVELLGYATALHDIGKVAIADEILNKPGKLTFEEFEIMKTHAEEGYFMLKDSSNEIIHAGAIIAHEHHEKWDGSGYPRGLSGKNIHIYGRITAIADVFDALGTPRVYKKDWRLDNIIEFMKEQRGVHFDPELIDIFLEHIDEVIFIRKKFRNY